MNLVTKNLNVNFHKKKKIQTHSTYVTYVW